MLPIALRGSTLDRIVSDYPVIRPERLLCKPDYNLDRVSGLHPSVHKPDMSVWTGSVFE
jgi:hypothetical protein